MALRIKRIEVEGFRAFRSKLTVELGERFTVIYGPPGSGKTSIVRALEFALFGETREVASRLMRREDLVNDFCDKARVAVVLAGGEGEILVERVLARSGASRLRVVEGSNEFYDEIGEHHLRSKLALTLDDFAWEIAVGHQELQALVHSSPSVRNRVLDELLGLADIRKLYRELSGKELKGYLKALRDELAKLGGESLLGKYEELKAKYRGVVSERDALARELEKLEARRRLLLEEYEALRARATEVDQLVEERGKLRALLESLGDEKLAKMPAVDESYVREYAERFKGELAETLELFYMGEEAEGVRRVDASNLASLLEVSRSAMDKMRSYMVRMEYELKDIQNEIRRLEDYINDLEDEMAEIEARIGELEHSRSEYDALVTRHGDPVSVAKKIAQLEVDAKALQAEEGRLRCARELQEDVLRQLRERGTATCPVCGSSITDAAALPRVEPPEALKLKRERIERMLQDLREVERKLRKLEPELRLLDDYESRRESLSKALDERLEELQELRASAEELEERLREARRRMAELARAYEQLDSYYKRLRYAELQEKLKELEEEIRRHGYDENRLNQLTRELKEVENRISVLKAKLDMLEASERQIAGELSALEAAVNSLKDLKKREERVAGLYSNLMAVRSALVEAHVKLRQKLVERLSEIASGIFAELERSSEYDAVEVQVQSAGPRGRRGHYVFRVRRKLDGSYVPALTRMSDGQRGLLALSLLLALRQLKPRSFAVLILDDPVPNVDEDTKVAIAKLLAEKMPAGLQVIFTTQSRRVAEELSPTAKLIAAGAAKS